MILRSGLLKLVELREVHEQIVDGVCVCVDFCRGHLCWEGRSDAAKGNALLILDAGTCLEMRLRAMLC